MADSLASQIITAIGGPENVRSLTHCATRLRFELADASKVDQNALEHMKGVLGAVPQSGDRFQVVIGGGVATVYENIMHLPEMANAGAASASGEGQKSNADVKAEARSKARGKVAWLDSFFEYLADSFRPILGVLLGASIIIALVNLLISLNVIPNDEASAGWVFVKAIWKGVFTAVSAFCNAGFDIFGTDKIGSLSTYDGNPVVILTVTALIACGGLGFFVWEEIKSKRGLRGLSLYSKMVLFMTAALLLLGTLFFFFSEWDNPHTLGPMPVWKGLLNALFQSTTLRTAGFYSISQGALTDVSLVMCILLMLVGGSSGSCAGGLKTGTVGVLLLALRSGLQGRDVVTFRGRTIPDQKVLSAMTLMLVFVFLFIAASMGIAIVDDVPYLAAAYETASAMATVGVTTGITPELSTVSHIILILLMYLGRVGVLSLSLAFMTQKKAHSKINYPHADVMIG